MQECTSELICNSPLLSKLVSCNSIAAYAKPSSAGFSDMRAFVDASPVDLMGAGIYSLMVDLCMTFMGIFLLSTGPW